MLIIKNMAKEERIRETGPVYTTISLLKTTKKELASICRKDQTYDDLLKDLITDRKAKGAK